MKKIITGGLVMLLLFACATTPKGITAEDRAAMDTVVNNWVKALQAEDIEALVETYWPEIDYTAKPLGIKVNCTCLNAGETVKCI